VAEAFVQYLYSPEAQAEFAKIGYRTIEPNPDAEQYPPIKDLATVKDYGGWDQVQQQFFETGALVSKIFKSINS
jgi:sulfate transport system substrate-binding protein